MAAVLRLAVLALLCGLAAAASDEVSPTEKVVTMLEDLQTQVVMEGKAEAKTYDKFACFCKDMSEEKTWDIEDAQDTINELSADRTEQDGVIAESTATIETRTKTMKEEAEKRAASHAIFQRELDDCYVATKEIDW